MIKKFEDIGNESILVAGEQSMLCVDVLDHPPLESPGKAGTNTHIGGVCSGQSVS
jgi:hypothetical protein